jgi:hypothetical protein
MITNKQFIKALEVIDEYKTQTIQQYNQMRFQTKKRYLDGDLLTLETFIIDVDLSVKASNTLRPMWIDLNENDKLIWTHEKCNVQLKHFNEIGKVFFLKDRTSIGKKTFLELQEMFAKVGIDNMLFL